MIAIAVLLAVFWTLLVLALAGDPTVEHSVTFENTMAPLLAVYAISAVAILIGRVLARIPPDK